MINTKETTEGRRIEAVFYDSGQLDTVRRYWYNGQWQALTQEMWMTGQPYSVRRNYPYGNYIDEVLSVNKSPTLLLLMHYYAHDHLYSPAALVNVNGFTVLERYEYDAYGMCRILDSNFDIRASSLYGNPYALTGRQLDILDNGTLHHMHYRHRDYSPQLGRFMQQDPLGITPAYEDLRQIAAFNQYRDGMSVYAYVKSNSIAGLDPTGKALWYCTTNAFGEPLGKHGYIYDDSFGDNIDSIFPGLGAGH